MKAARSSRVVTFLRPVLALALALLLGAAIISLVERSWAAPIEAYRSLFLGAFGSPIGIANMLRLTTPLLLTGTGIFIGLATGRFNIGAEGQMAVGALTAALVGAIPGLPAPISLALALLAGGLGGAIWALLPSLLREYRGVHEVITTLLLNYTAQNLTRYLATFPLKDPTGQAPQTRAVSAVLPRLLPDYDAHFGLVIALLAAVLVIGALYRTVWGYEIRVVGFGIEAATVAGIATRRVRVQAFLLSGALCGLAGAVTVLGAVPFRRFPADLYGIGYGFDGLAVALLVAGAGFPGSWLSGLALIPSALLFGALAAGADAMAFDTSTPKQIIAVVQAILILAIAARRTEER